MNDSNKEKTQQPHRFNLSKGERAPSPRAMANINWPPDKPPGGPLPEPLKIPEQTAKD